MKSSRREFLKKSLYGLGGLTTLQKLSYKKRILNTSEKIKISLNAYSFNDYLRDGQMDLDDLFMYCAKLNFDAVDPTGYYFPGYPNVPNDTYIYHLKRKAFVHGLEISGTGIRNDFTNPDPEQRTRDIDLIKEWIIVSSKLGAPIIRVFAGTGKPDGYSFEEIDNWMIRDLKECVNYAKKHGVMIGLQNHNDYLKSADHVLKIIELVDSEWFGIILDIGSFSTENPYEDIEKLAPHAVSWQIKENLGYTDRTVKVDLNKISTILHDINYRGYIPIETLGGDPMKKVPIFLHEVREAIKELQQ